MENVRPQAAGWGHLKCGFLSQHSLKTLPQKSAAGTFLVVHWLRLCLAMWGDAGLIPVGELRFLMPRSNGFHVQQLLSWSATTRVCALQGKISRDTTKTWHSKKKKNFKVSSSFLVAQCDVFSVFPLHSLCYSKLLTTTWVPGSATWGSPDWKEMGGWTWAKVGKLCTETKCLLIIY